VEGLWKEVKNVYTDTAKELQRYIQQRKQALWISQEVLKLNEEKRDTEDQ